jgi:hypothetical protein
MQETEDVARSLGMTLEVIRIKDANEIDPR